MAMPPARLRQRTEIFLIARFLKFCTYTIDKIYVLWIAVEIALLLFKEGWGAYR